MDEDKYNDGPDMQFEWLIKSLASSRFIELQPIWNAASSAESTYHEHPAERTSHPPPKLAYLMSFAVLCDVHKLEVDWQYSGALRLRKYSGSNS